MFGTLFLATVVGAGVGNAAIVPAIGGLNARANSPLSYFCSSNQNKCFKQKNSVIAYCSSYLAIPKVTKTVCSTKTSTITSVTATITGPPKVVRRTITSCAAPLITLAPGPDGNESLPDADGGDASAPQPEGRVVEVNELEERSPPAVSKPSCLESHKARSAISSACKCFSIKPSTKTVTDKKTVTRTIKTAELVPGTTSTTFVFAPEPTFLIASEQGGYLNALCPNSKDEQSGMARYSFDSSTEAAILFALNSDSTLAAREAVEGNLYQFTPAEGEEADTRIFNGETGGSPVGPLSCSISYSPSDGTCPLDCKVRSDADENLGDGFGNWRLGPPNTVMDLSYKTFGVTRSDPSQRGVCRSLRGGR